MSKIKLGPWPEGLDNVSDAMRPVNGKTRTVDSIRDAVDVTVDRNGWVDSRPGRTRVSTAMLHSLWTAADGTTYGGRGAQLVRYTYPDTITVLYELPVAAPIAFVDAPGGIRFTAGGFVGELRDTWQELGIQDGSMFTAAAIAAGGLAGGQYAVAVSYVDAHGREGGLGAAQFVNVPEGGGLSLSAGAWPDGADAARVYRTKQNGGELYLAATIPAGMLSYLVGAGDVGRMPTTQHLQRMVGGDYITHWRGRLFTASRNVLRWSEPLADHLWSPRNNWLLMPHAIRFIAPVEGGLWVGHSRGVVWVSGARPSEFAITRTAAAPPIAGSARAIDGAELPNDLMLNGRSAAVWLSERGFVIGTEDGRLIEIQSKRVRVPASPGAATLVQGNRLTAFTR